MNHIMPGHIVPVRVYLAVFCALVVLTVLTVKVASVDVVLGKPGYGTMSECMANATPVVYYPRPEFAEYPALRQALAEWGGGVQITKRDLIEGRWGASLMRASQLAPPRISCTGARQAARHIVRLAKSR
jgi:UDP-N-acetylglucosamine:LPS N-acetylglucosamine transferase